MSANPSTPMARVPYRNPGTPPIEPLRLSSPSPQRVFRPMSGDPHNPYPESPTSPVRSRSHIHPHGLKSKGSKGAGLGPVPHFSLAPKKRRWNTPRRLWRRVFGCLLLLGLGALVLRLSRGGEVVDLPGGFQVGSLRWATPRWQSPGGAGGAGAGAWAGAGDGVCHFVSPIEAYHRDLRRLRENPHTALEATVDHLNLTAQGHGHPHPHAHPQSHHHHYSPTGHLLVSSAEDAPHPIPLLLALGEKRWEELLSRQSRTLEEAVREYSRRYNRLPPRGFDLWWDFAMTHDLVLPDEYDRINLDLAPFFALPKREFKRRMLLVEEMAETFTLVVRDGEVSVQILDEGGLKWDGTMPRAKDMVKILQPFAHFLPDMKATFSIFDQPQIYLSWGRRMSLVDLGLRGEHTTHLQETDDAFVRLSRSCPPDSNYRLNNTFSEGKSFIYDSLEAGDPCQNPYLIPLHGLTLEHHDHDSHPRPHTQLLPLFSLAKTAINSDILITPLDQFGDPPGPDPKWEDKTSSKLVWRGSPTGISIMSRENDWRNSHRVRLHHFARNASTATTQFMVPDLGQFGDDDPEGEDEREDERGREDSEIGGYGGANGGEGGAGPLRYAEEFGETREAADFFFDVQLAGAPLQCNEEDGTCDDMAQEIEWAGFQPREELNKHKFLLDIDGNGWSGRFRRLMSTNSVVIKSSIFTEWFQPHLIPWFMYIPSKVDFSDLADILAFFRGTPKHPDLGFDETAKALAQNGQCFAQRMFRMVDLEAYMMRLFLEYARLATDEDIDMDFHLEDVVLADMGQDDSNVLPDEAVRESPTDNENTNYIPGDPGNVDDLGDLGDMGDPNMDRMREDDEQYQNRQEQGGGEQDEGPDEDNDDDASGWDGWDVMREEAPLTYVVPLGGGDPDSHPKPQSPLHWRAMEAMRHVMGGKGDEREPAEHLGAVYEVEAERDTTGARDVDGGHAVVQGNDDSRFAIAPEEGSAVDSAYVDGGLDSGYEDESDRKTGYREGSGLDIGYEADPHLDPDAGYEAGSEWEDDLPAKWYA